MAGTGGLGPGSILNLGASSKALQKQASGDESEVETGTLFFSDGLIEPPLIPDAEAQTADFYRFGDPQNGTPARYIEPRDDDRQTASIRVRTLAAKAEDEKDLIPAYTKFFLENVAEAHMERSQVVETFGEFYAFFFGERPPIYNYSGVLINAKNINWVQDFMFLYENFLRGTRCVEQRARIVLTYDGRQVEGFILGTSNQTAAATDGGVPFSFQVLVTSRKYLGFSVDFGFSTDSGGGTLTLDQDFQAMLDKIAGKEGKGSSDQDASDALNDVKGVMDGNPSAFTSIA